MIRLSLPALILCAQCLPAGLSAAPQPESEWTAAGRTLAGKMCRQALPENSEFAGVLQVRKPKAKPTVILLQVRTQVTATNWQTIYAAHRTNQSQALRLTVIHTDEQPNAYCLRWTPPSPGEPHQGERLTGNAAMVPFANTDFWLFDLGLEFFHWPNQRIVKKEMRRGRFCEVLESVNPHPAPGAYARVLSWIDQETGGLLRAEAYDPAGRLLKEFSVGSFKKINGQWHLRDMEIRNEQTSSRTRLELDLHTE